MLKLYQILTILAAPLVRLYLLHRKKKGKEDGLRINERFGKASISRPAGKLVWFHAASAGESISVLPIITRLSEQSPDLNFLITTGTVNSAKIMETMLPAKTIHQYVPVDILPYVQKFLKHWQPDLAIFAESEIWPNLITQTSRHCPLIMVNGRMSEKSFKSWKKYKQFSRQIFSSFSLCMTQSQTDTKYLTTLGAQNVKYIGNIKYGAAPLPVDQQDLEKLKNMIGARPVWLAASTHNEGELEEAIIASVHKELKKQYNNLLTIIVPRHAIRTGEILNELKSANLNVATRSGNDDITSNTDIYLADTMGELGLFYRACDIVLVGGSLVRRGGHNPLEPARLNCAIIIGPHAFNFEEINNEFISKDALVQVSGQDELCKIISEFFQNTEKTTKLQNVALELVNEKADIIDKIGEEILPYVKNTSI